MSIAMGYKGAKTLVFKKSVFKTALYILQCPLVLGITLLVFPVFVDAQTIKVIDQHGNPLPDALVTVSSPKISKKPKVPFQHSMDQVNKRFVPEVIAIQKGDSIQFPNSDDIRHHVYSFSVPKTFEIPLYSGEPANPVIFHEAGMVVVGCNIHDRMQGFIHIVEGKEFTLTDKTGVATFNGLPDEQLRIEISHHDNTKSLMLELGRKELLAQAYTVELEVNFPENNAVEKELSPLEKKFLELRHKGH